MSSRNRKKKLEMLFSKTQHYHNVHYLNILSQHFSPFFFLENSQPHLKCANVKKIDIIFLPVNIELNIRAGK